MTFLEKDLEEIINETPSETLRKRGLYFYGKTYRQLRIGNYGIADLVTIDKCYDFNTEIDRPFEIDGVIEAIAYTEVIPKLFVTVYELKKEKIGISAYLQALRYVRGIESYLDKRNFKQEIEFKIVLIGKELDTSGSFCFIPNFNENVEFYTYDYKVNGIIFKQESGYLLNNEGFKI